MCVIVHRLNKMAYLFVQHHQKWKICAIRALLCTDRNHKKNLRPCNELQWQGMACGREFSSSVSFSGTHKFLASLKDHEWKEHETQTLGQMSRMPMYWTLGYKLSWTQWIGFQCHGFKEIKHTFYCIALSHFVVKKLKHKLLGEQVP